MSSNFSFGNINVDSKKHALRLNISSNAVLRDRSTANASYNFTPAVLCDEIYDEESLNVICKFLERKKLTRYILLSAINCKISKEQVKDDQKTGIIEFYKTNISDFEKYIDKNAPILTVGAALYSLLQEDDIYPSHVLQTPFCVTHFWFSRDLTTERLHQVFPIESFRDLIETKKIVDKSKKPGPKGYPLIDTGILEYPRDSYKTAQAEDQITRLIKHGAEKPPRYPKLNKIFIESTEDFHERFYLPNKDRRGDYLAWDTETSGLHFMKDQLGCITLSYDGVTGYYVPWKYVIKDELNEILKNSRQILANGKFDIKFLWKNGVPAARVDEDTLLLAHTLDETRTNSLKAMAFYYSEYGGYERKLDSYRKKTGIDNFLEIPEEILREYAVMDAIVTRRVFDRMINHVRQLDKALPNEFSKDTLEDYYHNRRIPSSNMYAQLEYRGVYINKEKLDALRLQMYDYIDDLKRQLSEAFEVSKHFDWSSSQALGRLLEAKGWENLGTVKAGGYQTSDDQLTRWAKTHPEAKLLQTLRSVSVLVNTFVGDAEGTKGWSQYLIYHPEDNSYRMHCDYFPMGTDSGRTRCQKPNLQNTPTHGLFTKEIKSCISTCDDDNYLLATIDYSSLQMRLASIDGEIEDDLWKAFQHPGVDIHSQTAWSTFFANKEIDVTTIETEDGKKYLGEEQVFIEGKGFIFGKDLTEEDIGPFKTYTVHRRITADEFKRQKNGSTFKPWRQMAKSINFLMLFGGREGMFAENALETNWSEEQLDDFLKNNDCRQEEEEAKIKHKYASPLMQRYIAAAAKMRKDFFKGYPSLERRIFRERAYAREHGYCRSAFGAKRTLIELKKRGSYDEKTISGVLSNLENITANYRAQNYESCVRGHAMWHMVEWLKKNNYKSFIFNEIHDSIDICIYKPELEAVLGHMKTLCELPVPELMNHWCLLTVDCEISDLKQGDYYKGGRAPEEFGIDWDNLIDPDPEDTKIFQYEAVHKD